MREKFAFPNRFLPTGWGETQAAPLDGGESIYVFGLSCLFSSLTTDWLVASICRQLWKSASKQNNRQEVFGASPSLHQISHSKTRQPRSVNTCLPSNQRLYHIQYGGQPSSNVCMMSHDKLQYTVGCVSCAINETGLTETHANQQRPIWKANLKSVND